MAMGLGVGEVSGFFFFFQAEDGIRDRNVTGVQTCALPILSRLGREGGRKWKREQGDQETRRSGTHGYFLVKGIETRVVSQSIRMTPPLPWGRTAIVSCSTGRGSDSVFASTRTKSESAA